MPAEPLDRDEVAAFLTGRSGPVTDLEPLHGGAWSSAWGYRAGEQELVVRFGEDASWYEADRSAMAFAGPDLPVPEVLEVGTAPGGRAYAISVRHHGGFLEDTPPASATTLAPTLTRLLVALYQAPGRDAPVLWYQPESSPASWRDSLIEAMVDEPSHSVHGWSTALAEDRRLAALSTAAARRIRELLDACPERRDLVHGDLLHGNVLISPDATRVEAVLSWKCSARGDFVFDAAWCTFWSSWHPGIAAVDPLQGVLASPSVRSDPGALIDAAVRHHCYELHIGFTHLGWNIWTGNREALTATADRLAGVLERGPLPLGES